MPEPGDGTGPPSGVTCEYETAASSGNTCASLVAEWGLTEEALVSLNPGVIFSDLIPGEDYCVIVIVSTTAPTTTSPTTSLTSTTSTSSTMTSSTTTTTTYGDGITTPTPYQTGMASNCEQFHLVVSGDECAAIAAAAGISLTDFYAWNPAGGTACEYLDLGDYVCIDVIGVTPTITKSGNGITTPTPYQTAMVTDCDKFYFVSSGDECGTIAIYEDISLADFYTWNLAVGSTCEYLDLDYYVCVGV